MISESEHAVVRGQRIDVLGLDCEVTDIDGERAELQAGNIVVVMSLEQVKAMVAS